MISDLYLLMRKEEIKMHPEHFRCLTHTSMDVFQMLCKLEAKIFFKTYAILLTQILSPIIYFFFIITALSKTVGMISFKGILIGYQEYAMVGLISMSLMTQMSRIIYRVTVDRRYGFFALKMQSGLHPLLYIIAMSISPCLGYLIQMLVFAIFILIFTLKIPLINFILLTFAGFIALYFWLSVGVALTMLIETYQTRDLLLTFLIMPLSFSAPSFYVITDAPIFIQFLAWINPLTYQLQTFRGIAFGQPEYSALAIMISFSILSLFFSVWTLGKANLITNENI